MGVFPLYLRSRKDGDKISLNIGTKKVKDVLIDQKIPMKERNNLILLSNKDSVLWIPGIKKAYQTDCENLEKIVCLLGDKMLEKDIEKVLLSKEEIDAIAEKLGKQ